MDKIEIKAYAKINLFLEVCGLLENGYHEVRTVMQKVGIFDTVTVARGGSALTLTCSDSTLPCDSSNIALKAAIAYCEAAKLDTGYEIHIEKRIPIAGGMAGGSTDAAAVLRALNKIEGALSEEKLLSIAESLGADVPFFMYDNLAMFASGIGTNLHPCTEIPRCFGLFVCGNEKKSTKEAYQMLDRLERKNFVSESEILLALSDGDFEKICANTYNAFSNILPVYRFTEEKLKNFGASAAFLCGSGATVCGLFLTESAAKHAQKNFTEKTFICGINAEC